MIEDDQKPEQFSPTKDKADYARLACERRIKTYEYETRVWTYGHFKAG